MLPAVQRFGVIQPGHRVTKAACVSRDRCGATHCFQKQVGGSVVAHDDRRFAQFLHGHARRPDTEAYHRRPTQYRALVEHDAPIQFLDATIDTRQLGRREQQLERATHQEALVTTMPNSVSTAGVEYSYAQPTAVLAFQRSQSGRCILRGGG